LLKTINASETREDDEDFESPVDQMFMESKMSDFHSGEKSDRKYNKEYIAIREKSPQKTKNNP